MEKSIKNLDNRKAEIFSFRRIIEEKLIPWSHNSRTLLKIINADMRGENILEVKVTALRGMNRYSIRGSNLLRYIRKYGNVLMATRKHDKNDTNDNDKGSGDKGKAVQPRKDRRHDEHGDGSKDAHRKE